MARVFAHATHYYTHFNERGTRVEYVFPAGEAREVPDDVAIILTAAHPQKLVILGAGEDRPGQAEEAAVAVAEPESYETREIEDPETDRMMKPRRSRRAK